MATAHEIITSIRGDAALRTSEALDLLCLLVPILDAVPDHEEAQSAAYSVISRMPREDVAAALLDWWFVVATGGQTPLGWAYNLPDTIEMPLRSRMAEVIALGHAGIGVPIGRWLRESRALPERLLAIDTLTDLDSYGKSKLPDEREVWAWFQSELEPTVRALRAGNRANEFVPDPRQLERELGRTNIEPHSRRWDEIVKRVDECTEGINELVRVQAVAAPWLGLSVPQPLDALPNEVTTALGDLAPAVFEPLLAADDRWWLLHAREVADRAEAIAAELEELDFAEEVDANEEVDLVEEIDLAWWATLLEHWCNVARAEGTHVETPCIDRVIARRNSIRREIDKLRAAGVDADEAELCLMDHNLSAASRAVREFQDKLQRDRRIDALRNQLHHFRREAEQDQTIPAGWIERVAEAEAILSRGDVDSAKRFVDLLAGDLRRTRRSGEIAELRELRGELERLAAAPVVFADLDAHLAELEGDAERSVDRELKRRLDDRLRDLLNQRRIEVKELLAKIHSLLDGADESLGDTARHDFELKIPDIEHAELSGELMQARQLALELLSSIQDNRVYRWDRGKGESELVEHVVSYCTQELDFDEDDVRRLYVAAKTKPFIILAGLTGSGKSTIARLFAGALGADARNGRFRRIAVRPDWIDQSDVLGLMNPISSRFEPGWLALVARQCEKNLDQIHVVLLDEMNLAPVEQYLAEYLSALEESRSGYDATRLPLYSEGADPVNKVDWPSSLPFPRNLIMIGTVNVDETTRVLSERVLDRANVLQLSVAMSDAHHSSSAASVRPWYVPFSEWDAVCVRQPDGSRHSLLVELGEILHAIGIGVGARAHVELERFLANSSGIIDPNTALDLGIIQRIIPKIRGFKRDLAEGLDELQDLLERQSCDRSARIIGRWLADSVSDDEFIDGTDARIGLIR